MILESGFDFDKMSAEDFQQATERSIDILTHIRCIFEDNNMFFEAGDLDEVLESIDMEAVYKIKNSDEFDEIAGEVLSKIRESIHYLEYKFYRSSVEEVVDMINRDLGEYE